MLYSSLFYNSDISKSDREKHSFEHITCYIVRLCQFLLSEEPDSNYYIFLLDSIPNWIFNINRTHRNSPVKIWAYHALYLYLSYLKKDRKERKRGMFHIELAFFSLLSAEKVFLLKTQVNCHFSPIPTVIKSLISGKC